MREHRRAPISSGLSGLRVIEILEAASRSIAAQGKPVKLEQRRRVPSASGRLPEHD